MKLSSSFVAAAVVSALLSQLFLSRPSNAEDWPAWRHDAGRSGVTGEQLPAELHRQWSLQLPSLKAAWPEDVRLQFDANYQPIVAGFCELESGGTGRFTGFRSGCRNSLIPANGLLNAPNFSHGCSCSYSLFTSLALMHVPESDLWTYSAHKTGDGPVQHLGINFGARGDRTAPNGTLWMDHPSVGGASPNVPIELVTDDPRWFRLPSTQVAGDGLKWVAASGVSGVKSIKLPVAIGKATGNPATRGHIVRLSFVEPGDAKPGQRIFDLSIQGRNLLQKFDVVKEAGGARKILVKEFPGVMADRDVTITFTPKTGQALICGVEIVAEPN